jgi:Bacterial Ig domain/Fibronectin type III domain
VLVFDRGLTASERTTVNAYLNGKYALVPAMPATPTNLAAMAISPTQIALTWDEKLDGGATQIGIQRSVTSNGTYSVVAQIPDATSYVDTNLSPGTTYYYQVAAINLTLWSPTSNVAQATTPAVGASLPLNALALWLKADTGLFQNGTNTPVNQWMDQSGNNNNAAQQNKPNQPSWMPGIIGDRPVVRFDGTSSYLNLPSFMNGVTGAEAFVVLKTATNDPSRSQSLWEMGGDSWNEKAYPDANGSINDDFGSAGGAYNTGVHASGALSQSLNQYHIYEVTSQSNNWAAWINGTLITQTRNNTVSFAATPTLGTSSYALYTVWWTTAGSGFPGDIAEVLVFNRGLTADERITVNTYLNGKYELVAALPATPTNLVATVISPTQVGLSWNETLNGGTTRISIERLATNNWTYQVVAQITAANSYVDTNLTPGTMYYYRVRAINLAQWSPYSSAAQVITPAVGASLPFGNLQLWLKADAGLFQSNTNTPINLWADQSGNNNNASQFTAISQPLWAAGAIGDHPAVHFNGTNSFFSLPHFLDGANSAEAFIVLKTTVTNSYQSLWEFGGDGWDAKAYPNSDGSISDDFGSSVVKYLGVPAQSLTQYHLYEVSSQNDNWAAWINGVLLYQTGETDFNTVSFANGMSLGQTTYAVDDEGYYFVNSYFAGNVAEVLVFNRALNADERVTLNGYLNNKYGLESPIVSITNPVNSVTLTGVTNIAIDAIASDTSGISQVQFFQGTTSLGIVTNTPYSIIWSNVILGSYALTARATDNNGLIFTSAVVDVTVAGISIISPTNTSVLAAPANIPISATAVDGAGISRVQFFQGTTSLGTVTNTPYSLVWSNVTSGTYALTAIATDSYGQTLTSAVVNVTVDTLPSVTLTNPANNARFAAGNNINLGASASDADGTVARVEFFQGTNSLGFVTSSPYNLIWSNVTSGAYALTARATDNNGLYYTSSVVNIMVAGISITNPANNVVLTAPASIPVAAAITDNVGINQVQFFQGTTSLGTVTSAPYSITWSSVAAGTYTLTAVASDSGGLVFTSSVVNVIVDTNPTSTDRDSDGVSDYIEYVEGRNPLVGGTVADTNGMVNLQVYTPLH